MDFVSDFRGNKFSTKRRYQRIISLVPGITEFLIKMKFPVKNIVGRTKYCIYPKKIVENIFVLGDIEKIDFDMLRYINPDLVIVNKEENPLKLVKDIDKTIGEKKVFVTDITSINDSLNYLKRISKLLKLYEFQQFIDKFNQDLFSIKNKFNRSVLYFVWKNPYMVAGDNTFINDWLQILGLNNKAKNFIGKYPSISLDEIIETNPQYIFLSSKPYSFNMDDKKELNDILGKNNMNTIIKMVDGEYFCWYGWRMLPAIDYFRNLNI